MELSHGFSHARISDFFFRVDFFVFFDEPHVDFFINWYCVIKCAIKETRQGKKVIN